MENLADRVRLLMKLRGMTAKDLGQKSDVEFRTVEGWLGAKAAVPRADSAVRVAQTLGTSVEYLVTGKMPISVPARLLSLVVDLDLLSEDELDPIRTLARMYSARHRESKSGSG
jgi:transcriptional regulator with XRE-family HTH domain